MGKRGGLFKSVPTGFVDIKFEPSTYFSIHRCEQIQKTPNAIFFIHNKLWIIIIIMSRRFYIIIDQIY